MYYQYYRRQTPEEDYLSTQQAKSLYRSRVGSQFCGINLWDFISKIWAGFGSVGNDEKIILGRLWETFEGDFFLLSWGKKYCSIRTKRCITFIYIYMYFFGSKQAKYSQPIVVAVLKTPLCTTFYIMTLTTGNWNFSQAETATRGSTHQTLQKALPVKPDWKLAPIQPTAWFDNEVGTFLYNNFLS